MFDRIVQNLIWPVLGMALVVIALALMFYYKSESWETWVAYFGLIMIGLAILSPERTRAVAELLTRVVRQLSGKDKPMDEAKAQELVEKNKSEVLGAKEPPPPPDEWFRNLRPVLHQAAHFSVPTYYLNTDLAVIDWNVAFEMIFADILGAIRNKHVNHFIVRLANRDKVLDHARDFTEKVRGGQLPLVDIEDLSYRSPRYGPVEFAKVAAQLHDSGGKLQGWTVALFPRVFNWGPFLKDLYDKLTEDKLWSVYSASYDRVLLEYPPYRRLIQDVIAVVPPGKSASVVDLGAGTGNVTAALLEAGHRVTAVENNLAMLDRFRARQFDARSVKVVKAPAEQLDTLCPEFEKAFDAAVMVNVLYAVDDPLACLQSIHKTLKPNGVLGLSTTHSESRLDPLLEDIKRQLQAAGRFDALANDYERLREANKQIELTIALRHTRDDYRQWLKAAGFEVIRDVPSTYEGAVMLLHAKKVTFTDSSV